MLWGTARFGLHSGVPIPGHDLMYCLRQRSRVMVFLLNTRGTWTAPEEVSIGEDGLDAMPYAALFALRSSGRTRTGLAPATSAPGLRLLLPHLHRDCACSCHICTGTGLAPASAIASLGRSHRSILRGI